VNFFPLSNVSIIKMRLPALLLAAFLAATLSPLSAEPREWKSADGKQSFTGEYVYHDAVKVTIRRESHKKDFTVELAKLSKADRDWIVAEEKAAKEAAEKPNANAVFDTLCFGDKRDTVLSKLKKSTMLEAPELDEELLGRVGLNGIFRTRQKIGGLTCELFFDWTGAGTLKEISLQTEPVPKNVYVNRLKASWTELADLLTTLHGQPEQAGEFPKEADLKNDMLVPSHLWKLKGGGSALLGTSMTANRCMIVVRLSTSKVRPVEVP